MGMAKRAHIATLLALPRIAAAWRGAHGRRADRGRHRRGLRGVRADERRGRRPIRRSRSRRGEHGPRASRARPQDRLDHRLHARDHRPSAARRRRAGLSPPTVSSAPGTPPRGDRARSCCTGRGSSSAPGRLGAASRSTTPRSAYDAPVVADLMEGRLVRLFSTSRSRSDQRLLAGLPGRCRAPMRPKIVGASRSWLLAEVGHGAG